MSQDLIERFGKIYQAGSVIFREGDSGEEMYIIQNGEVRISKKARMAEQVLATLKDGDFFGEMAIFTDQLRSATATAVHKSVILQIDKSSFKFMLSSNDGFAMNLIKRLCERLKRANEQIEEILVLSKETRLLKALEEFWRIAGQKDTSGEKFVLNYERFLDHVRHNMGISVNDTKSLLRTLNSKDLIHVRKDMSGTFYITFTEKVFEILDTLRIS